MKTITIPVKGMDCASCVRTVEKVVKSNDGVSQIDVNLATESAKISFDESKIAVQKLITSIINAGYDVPQEKTRFSVQDIDCASCVKSIETWVSALEGVTQVDVNFAAKTVTIQHDTASISSARLKKEIIQIGYTPVLDSEVKEQKLAEEKIYKSYRNRLLLAIIATLPVFIVSMFMIEFPGHEWMQLILTTVVVFGAGRGFFRSGFYSLKAKAPNMDVLVSIGASAAYFYSVAAILFPHWFHALDQHPHLYFETAATIVTLILTGNLLEKRATAKTSDSLKKLIGLQPKSALIQKGSDFIEEEIEMISVGEIVLVRPGERVPLDGEITKGQTSLDQSTITGESLPVDVSVGDKVMAGSVNNNQAFQFKVEKTNENSTLSRIIYLVKEANGNKAPIQRLADKVSAVFVPTVLAIALTTFFVWFFFVDTEFAFRYAVMTSVAVMIIACPCAMGLAAPTAVMVGIGRGAENGMLIRGGESLEKLYEVDTVVLDKTGTLTKGEIKVQQVIPLTDLPLNEILFLAGSAEKPSEHPIAKGIVKYVETAGIQAIQPDNFVNTAGSGIDANVNGVQVSIKKTSESELENQDATIKSLVENSLQQLDKSIFGTLVMLYVNDKPVAIFNLSDSLRDDSAQAVKKLTDAGIQVIMLTGDNEKSAGLIAKQAGIQHIIANVLPHEKAAVIDKLMKENKKVAMVGDGINDAPSLAKAYVGFSMGHGTDIAMESSDVILLNNSLLKISEAIQLSKQTVLTIKQNLFWAFFYNVMAIPIAAGVLWPFYGVLLSPMIGAATMAFSDVFVIGNSILLKYKKL